MSSLLVLANTSHLGNVCVYVADGGRGVVQEGSGSAHQCVGSEVRCSRPLSCVRGPDGECHGTDVRQHDVDSFLQQTGIHGVPVSVSFNTASPFVGRTTAGFEVYHWGEQHQDVLRSSSTASVDGGEGRWVTFFPQAITRSF